MEEELSDDEVTVICREVVPGESPGVMGSLIIMCDGCLCAVWISPDTMMLKAKHLCNACAGDLDTKDVRITEATRERLRRELGISDEEIEAVLADFATLARRQRE